MKISGIQISDSKENVLAVSLHDVLEEISNGMNLYWSILFIDGLIKSKEDLVISELEAKINHSENGLLIKWNDLLKLSNKFFQTYETIILASKNINVLHRYTNDHKMHQECDIVIELIDCAFWNIYSHDQKIIDKFMTKFKSVKMIESEDAAEN